jgi:hypothetical protein
MISKKEMDCLDGVIRQLLAIQKGETLIFLPWHGIVPNGGGCKVGLGLLLASPNKTLQITRYLLPGCLHYSQPRSYVQGEDHGE